MSNYDEAERSLEIAGNKTGADMEFHLAEAKARATLALADNLAELTALLRERLPEPVPTVVTETTHDEPETEQLYLVEVDDTPICPDVPYTAEEAIEEFRARIADGETWVAIRPYDEDGAA